MADIVQIVINGTAYDLKDAAARHEKPDWNASQNTPAEILNKPDLSQFITNTVDNLVNYYLMSETYSKAEVDDLIAAVSGLSFTVVETLPEASAATMGSIFLVPSADPEAGNVKDEYITIRNNVEGRYVYSWEIIGSTAIDLSGYVTTSDLNTALAGKVDKVNGKGLSTNDYDDTEKAKVASAYQKPVTGIPASDLAEGVIPDISGKADKVTSATNGNFAGLDANGNLIDSGHKHSDYLTSHQDISGKADKVTGATNGNFAGLDSNGNLTDSGKKASDFLTSHQDISGKADKVSGGTENNFAALDANGNLKDSGHKHSDYLTSHQDISGKADKVSNPTSGNFASLDGNGNLADSGKKASDFLTSHQDISGKADKVSNPTNGNFAGLDSNGNLTDSGKKASDFLTSHQDISGKEDKSNKVTSFGSTPSDTKYPSEKLVKDSLDAKQPTIDSSHKLPYSLVSDTPTIPDAVEANPTVPSGTTPTALQNLKVGNNYYGVPQLPTVDNTPTANSNNLVKSGGVYSEVHPAVQSSQPAGGFAPNVVYDLGTLTGTVTFALAAGASGVANPYHWTFDTGSTAPTITWPSNITWPDGVTPSVDASKHYEVFIRNGYASMLVYSLS